jgi:hypothetical protein
MRLWLSLHIVVLFAAASSARADEQTVECDEARTACEDAMLAACPEGATILNERVALRPSADGGEPVKHYAVRFACGAAPPAGDPQPEPLEAAEPSAGAESLQSQVEPREPFTGFLPESAPPTWSAEAPARAERKRERERAELRHLDDRIATLEGERRRFSLAGPVTLTALGGVGFAFSLQRLVANKMLANAEEELGSRYATQDYRDRITMAAGGVVLTGIVTLSGLVWLQRTLTKRREGGPELKELRRRRRDLMRYGLSFDAGSRQLQLRAHF